jgi:hypothetical protein
MADGKRSEHDGSSTAKPSEPVDRRGFFRRSSQALAVAAFGASCGEDGTTPPGGDVGSARLMISGITGTGTGSIQTQFSDGSPTGLPSPNLPAPVNGVITYIVTNIPVGTYRLVYTPPSNHIVLNPPAIGGEHFRSVTVELGGEAQVSFTAQVEAGPPPAGLVWASDWSTARGTTVSAVGDGGRWPTVGPMSGDQLEVVSAAGLNFPSTMSSVLAVRYNGGTARGVIADGLWDYPAVGQHIYYRVYWRMGVGDAVANSQHPLGSGSGADLGGYAMVHRSEAGNDFAFWMTNNYGPDFNQIHRWQTTLTRNTTYRIEWHLHRTAIDRVIWQIRVYNASNTLVRTLSDFVCSWSGHGHSLADAIECPVEPTVLQAWGNMTISHQGLWQVPDASGNRIYYGGVAVSRSDWCGPYVVGERG